MHLFPIYVNLEKRKCLVVGGGKVAERKVENLMEYGAVIRVVSPEVEPGLQRMAEEGRIELRCREFQKGDLEQIFIAFVATDQNSINQEVVDACRDRGILVNAVDDPPRCDFYVPSIVRQGSLVLAISTEGKSPAFARRLRQQLETIITPEYGEFVDLLGEVRQALKSQVPDIEKRKEILEYLVYSDIFDLYEAGEKEKARGKVGQCMSSWQE